MKFKLKKDSYRKARGGYSRFLNIFCSKCGFRILLYQKDGPGILKRLYLDRIFAPEKWSRWQKSRSIKEIPNLNCDQCGAIIGSPYIYEKENRKSFRLKEGTFSKKIGKGIL